MYISYDGAGRPPIFSCGLSTTAEAVGVCFDFVTLVTPLTGNPTSAVGFPVGGVDRPAV